MKFYLNVFTLIFFSLVSFTCNAEIKILAQKNNISLLKESQHCIFSIMGHSKNNKAVDQAIWFPSDPYKLYISTSPMSASEVLAEYELFQNMLLKGYPKRWSKHFLIANNGKESYVDLTGITDGLKTAGVFEASFKKSLLPLLRKEKSFVVNLKTKKQKKPLTTQFELTGFSKLYADFKYTCKV